MNRKPPKKPYLKTLHITVSAELESRVNELARQETRSIRNMVLVLMQEALATREKGQPA